MGAPIIFNGQNAKLLTNSLLNKDGNAIGGYVVDTKATSFTAVSRTLYLVNTSSGAVTATLPAGAAGAKIKFVDASATWSTAALTITPSSGQNFQGRAANASLVLTATNTWVELAWDATASQWCVLAGMLSTGEKNYVVGTSTATGWVTSGTITIATSVTPAELPRATTTASGIKFTSSVDEAYGKYSFTIDSVDKTKKLKVQFAAKPVSGFAAGDYRVEMWTSSDGVTYTETALSTDVSGDSNLANATLIFGALFDATTNDYYQLRIVRNVGTVGSIGLVISDVIVGPGILAQTMPVGDWTAWTPSFSGGFGTVSTSAPFKFVYRRVGSSMEIMGTFIAGTTTTGTPYFSLPTGCNIDTTNVTALKTVFGKYHVADGTNNILAAGQQGIMILESSGTIDRVHFAYNTTTGPQFDTNNTSALFSTGELITVNCTVPIATWAGALNIGQNEVEYAASTTGTWDAAAAAANTVYGPAGAPITGSLTASRTKTVRFNQPIQTGDRFEVQFSDNQYSWFTVGTGMNAEEYVPFGVNDGVAYGFLVKPGSVPATDVDVVFNQYCNRYTGTGASSKNWRPSTFWRIVKSKGGSTVGFGSATISASGLIDTTTQSFAGDKTFTGVMTYTGMPCVSAYSNSVQTVANGTADAGDYLKTYTEVFDITNSFAPTTGVFTAPVAGKYRLDITANWKFTVNPIAQDNILVGVYKNGSLHTCNIRGERVKDTTNYAAISTSIIVDCAVNDTLNVFAQTNIGAGGSTRTLTFESKILAISKVA